MNTCVKLAVLASVIGLSACGSGGGAGSPMLSSGELSPGGSGGTRASSSGGASTTSSGGTVTDDGTVASSSSSSSGIVSGELSFDLDSGGEALPADPPIDTVGNIQSGLLTAGDYDDQLNSHLYQKYVSDVLQAQRNQTLSIPYPDLAQRIAIKVLDNEGEVSTSASINLLENGEVFSELKTPANGTVYIYPSLDELPNEFQLQVTDRFGDVSTEQTINLEQLSGERLVEVQLPASNQVINELDLMLVVDTTGSMGDELEYLKVELDAIVDDINQANANLDIKVGLVVYRDVDDDYVVREYDFSDAEEIRNDLGRQRAEGGGDFPESMGTALNTALAQNWRDNSTKIMLLVADAPPQDFAKAWDAAEIARDEQIHIVPVAASGVDDRAEFLMRAMAAYTHSRYIFITDDSGVGNSHKEPEVDCYIVTRLDSMIERVVSSLISGERVEPESDEIIRAEGNYDKGKCEAEIDAQLTARDLDVSSDTVNSLEINSYFSAYSYGPTLMMYKFVDEKTVLKISFSGDSDGISSSASLYLFADDAAEDNIDYWVNNQYSDALYPDAAVPVETFSFGEEAITISESNLVGTEEGLNGDEYDHFRVSFELADQSETDVYTLAGFEDEVDVYVMTKDILTD